MAKRKRLTIPSVDEGVEQRELSCVAVGSAKWYNCYGELFSSFL